MKDFENEEKVIDESAAPLEYENESDDADSTIENEECKPHKNNRVRKITGVALFIAIEIVLSFISNYVQTGQVNLNLALIPIIIGACAYGPIVGLALGILNGVITLTAPATLGVFFVVNPAATVFLCLLKTGLAGLVSGLIYKALYKHKLIAAILSSVVVPVVNTGLFILGTYAFFIDVYSAANVNGINVYEFVLVSVLSVNFAIESVLCLVVSPAILKVLDKLRLIKSA